MEAVAHDTLRTQLTNARAEQAEALRRALHLRSNGSPLQEVRAAMEEAAKLQTEVNRLQRMMRGHATH